MTDCLQDSSLVAVSLFSGAMGLDLGLEAAGLNVRVSTDFDPWCCKTMQANGRNFIPGDIRELIKHDPECSFLLSKADLLPGEAFLVAGGPPCQPFSTAGKRLAIADPRGSLFREFCHVVKKVRPRFFVMENVKGLLSAAIRPIKDGKKASSEEEVPGSVFNVIKNEFAELGYKIIYGVLDAVHYGVPQFRERLIILGSRDHENIFLPMPTHFPLHQNPSYRWKTLYEAIGDLEDNPGICGSFSKERLKYLRQVPPGGNWRSLPDDAKELAMGGAFNSGGGKVGFYRRLNYDQPAPTLITSPVQKATMLCHPTADRPLSVREYARIQQFPDDWQIVGSTTDCYRQIGNAVPSGLGKAIGQALLATAEGGAEIKVKRFRGTSVHSGLFGEMVVSGYGSA